MRTPFLCQTSLSEWQDGDSRYNDSINVTSFLYSQIHYKRLWPWPARISIAAQPIDLGPTSYIFLKSFHVTKPDAINHRHWLQHRSVAFQAVETALFATLAVWSSMDEGPSTSFQDPWRVHILGRAYSGQEIAAKNEAKIINICRTTSRLILSGDERTGTCKQPSLPASSMSCSIFVLLVQSSSPCHLARLDPEGRPWRRWTHPTNPKGLLVLVHSGPMEPHGRDT